MKINIQMEKIISKVNINYQFQKINLILPDHKFLLF